MKHLARVVRAQRSTQRHLRSFVRAFPPTRAYQWGQHTSALCAALQAASDAVLAGKTSHQIVVMPPQHGKSALASRRLPPWHLVRQPEHEIILTSYSGNLATDLSYDARRCFRHVASAYGTGIDEERGPIAAWRTVQGGGVYAVGLGGSITGHGADILIVDDYLKNREEAESELIRDKIWDSFRNDLLTRLHAAHAVVIPCTRWHEDDLVGRILREQDSNPQFPRFEMLRYPALAEDGQYLWPDHYSASWYEAQRAAIGSYAWQALYQGDPQPRRGNMLQADKVRILNRADWPDGQCRWARGWDLASSGKERMRDDPDYTVGLKAGMQNGTLYIEDVVRGQWRTGERDRHMMTAAEVDGSGTRIGVEAVAGYKDTAQRFKDLLRGKSIVEETHPDKDKVARASVLEPLFESGNVVLKRAPWNDEFLAECRAFPSGRHDDQIDALVVAHKMLSKPQARVSRL